MMNQLYIREGDIVVVQNVSLELATFSKFQPQSVDFLDITNPKAVYPPLYDHQLHSHTPRFHTTSDKVLGYGNEPLLVILPLTDV